MICLTAQLEIPEHLKGKAGYALRELCHRLGFGLRVLSKGPTDILYTVSPQTPCDDTLVLGCNPNLYVPATACQLMMRGDAQIWEQCNLSASRPLDFIGGTYRLLTMLDESQVRVEARDRMGRFPVPALPRDRQSTTAVPLVELHAELLAGEIRRRWPQLSRHAAPLWPGNRQYVVLMSHDCDHVHIGAAAELATNLAKAILRPSRLHAALVRVGTQNIFRGRENPLFRFEAWKEWELQRGLRSVFYVPVRPNGVPFDRHDCKSTVTGPVADWERLGQMARSGWEFGLHAPIRARAHPWSFRAAREWLEGRLQHRVSGVRHHYFALDWLEPHQCHKIHADAGFDYDSSIAFHDAPGFRSGTCLPYAAFDPVANQEIPLSVLPCNLMDGHILEIPKEMNAGTESAIERARSIVAVVRQHRGVLVLNWHQEAGFNRLNYEGWLDVLNEIMSTCLQDSIWTTTAAELCSYWKRRTRELDEACETRVGNSSLSLADS